VPESKSCSHCGKSFPLTKQYWHVSKGEFHSRCRKCRNKKQKDGRVIRSQKKLAEIERGAVDTFIAAARVGGTNIPHSAELLEVAMKYFGGVEGFVTAFMKQYYDAPAGGAFRTKQLDSILKLITANTAMGGAKKPLELMTEEELEAQYRRDVLAAAMTIRVNGEPVRLEDHANVRDVQVVASVEAGGISGGVPEIPSAVAERPVGKPADGQVPLVWGVGAGDGGSAQ
jgi:hypothetical protein